MFLVIVFFFPPDSRHLLSSEQRKSAAPLLSQQGQFLSTHWFILLTFFLFSFFKLYIHFGWFFFFFTAESVSCLSFSFPCAFADVGPLLPQHLLFCFSQLTDWSFFPPRFLFLRTENIVVGNGDLKGNKTC